MLTAGERALVRLSAALASRSEDVICTVLAEAARDGAAEQVEETLLQSYLFLGYPAALNGFRLWREASGRPAPDVTDEKPTSWEERGPDICRTVYAGQYERLKANVRRLHPDMERWMIVEGYGKVLGRPGLSLELRELCIVAILAVLNAPRQLYSHLRGALNAGADPARVEAALGEAEALARPEDAAVAARVWRELRERHTRE